MERTSAQRERDAPLVTEKLGATPHAVGERHVHGPTGTVDDRLAQLRALGVRRREVADILGGELGIEAGDEHCRAHDLGEARRIVLEGGPWRRRIGRTELQ